MTSDGSHQDVHDLLADIRAVATSLTQPGTAPGLAPGSAFVRNAELGGAAYSRGPEQAVFMVAQMGALRFDQINQARRAQGREPMPFPRDRMFTEQKRRFESVTDSIEFIAKTVDDLVPDRPAIDAYVAKHGLPGFMMLVQAATELGKILVEEDPAFDSLSDLFAQEALADELDWLNWDSDTP